MNNNLSNQLEIKQVNPKIRLILLIFCNWLWSILLVALGGGWATWFYHVPFLAKHLYIIGIFIGCFGILTLIIFYSIDSIGIKYLPKDLRDYYLEKNKNQLEKINNLKITNVNQLFNTTPICKEVYLKKSKFIKNNFVKVSWIEKSKNRLVVNGKINDSDFSWGIITKMKKNSIRNLFFTILYFGPLLGIGKWLTLRIVLNSVDLSKPLNWKQIINPAEYKKLGCYDLVAKNLGTVNSENYLIFAAKLQNQSDSIVLIPINNQYDWPANLSETQKQELQNLIKEMSYLPSIYISQDNISIIMKKYHYNAKDNNELQTWELLKQENSNNEIQFNYLNNAIKIYHIFNKNSFDL